jgi:hypothetical protein
MGSIYKISEKFIDYINPTTAFVEIGSDRLEGSTSYFADLAQKHNVFLHSVDIETEVQQRILHPNIIWHTAKGSDWCELEWPKNKKFISVLYLDNFDYRWNDDVPQDIWNKEFYNNIKGSAWPENFTEFNELSDHIKFEIKNKFNITEDLLIKDYFHNIYKKNNLNFNNNNCQIEHFKQIYFLYPWLHKDCLVIFDDTVTINDCWIGKNGPGVVFLQSMGFDIIAKENNGVILSRR